MKSIIFFDGLCNLCNGAVRFIVKHDPKRHFCFASLQSDFAKEYLGGKGFELPAAESILLTEDDEIFSKSTAALKICRRLSGGWKLCVVFLIIPRFIRDSVYAFVARRRYRWFGKRDYCMIPDESVKNRFLD